MSFEKYYPLVTCFYIIHVSLYDKYTFQFKYTVTIVSKSGQNLKFKEHFCVLCKYILQWNSSETL